MKRRIICILLAIMLFSSTVSARTLITAPSEVKGSNYTDLPLLAVRLDEVFQGKCGLYNNSSCTDAAILPLGSRMSVNGIYYINSLLFGKQCYIYANAVYYRLFGEAVRTATSLKNSEVVMTGGSTVSYERFVQADIKCGAYMRTTNYSDGTYNGYEGHSLIILGYDADSISYLEGNGDNNGLIRITVESWSEFNQRKLSGRGRYVCHVVQPTDTYYEATYGGGTLSCSKGHNASEWVITVAPSTTANGQRVLICKKCNEKVKVQTLYYSDLSKMFDDLPSDAWFYNAVSYVYYSGFFKGITETHFGPNDSMTRAMFVTVLGRLEGISENYQGKSSFKDVKSGKYYSPYVAWCCDQGIIEGYEDNTFRPNNNITREQICKIMYKYCETKGIELPDGDTGKVFLDDSDISKWAREYVYACRLGGIVNGQPGKGGYNFFPLNGATRAEVATILYNFTGNYMPKTVEFIEEESPVILAETE